MGEDRFTDEEILEAKRLWTEHRSDHDLSGEKGRTAGIDPRSGKVWLGDSILEIVRERRELGLVSPLFFLRVGYRGYFRGGSLGRVMRPIEDWESETGESSMATVDVERAVRRFTREEYHRMADVGILDPDERVELVEGEIVTMPAMHSPHASCITRVEELLHDCIRPRALIRTQLPIALGDDSEPEPDFAIVTPRSDHYRDAHPGPVDVLFLIEAMDSSRYDDRRRKVPMYARYGIQELWLVDLATSTVDVCTNPSGRAYLDVKTMKRGDSIHPAPFPDLEFTIDDILG